MPTETHLDVLLPYEEFEGCRWPNGKPDATDEHQLRTKGLLPSLAFQKGQALLLHAAVKPTKAGNTAARPKADRELAAHVSQGDEALVKKEDDSQEEEQEAQACEADANLCQHSNRLRAANKHNAA